MGGKGRLNLGREMYTEAIYEFVNLEVCIILTTALDVELAFGFIKQLFYSTLCLHSSPHRCIKVTNVSNKGEHDESYLIQFWLKDLLYVGAERAKENTVIGVGRICVSAARHDNF